MQARLYQFKLTFDGGKHQTRCLWNRSLDPYLMLCLRMAKSPPAMPSLGVRQQDSWNFTRAPKKKKENKGQALDIPCPGNTRDIVWVKSLSGCEKQNGTDKGQLYINTPYVAPRAPGQGSRPVSDKHCSSTACMKKRSQQ